MKLSWTRNESTLRRPVKDIEELLQPSRHRADDGGVMGRDLETSVTVERILDIRSKYKKQAQHN